MNIEPIENKIIDNTLAGKLVFFLLCAALVGTTLIYGAVHPPIIALFYIIVAAIVVLWVVDAYISGVFRFNRSLLQLPLLAAIVYGIIQIIPFGTLAATGGVEGIGRTISADPYLTRLTVVHFVALFLFFAAMLAFTDSYKRVKSLVVLITVFGFVYAFYAIIQSFLSPQKIYGIYETQYAVPFGSFVNRHNFAAFMEMSIAVPLGLLFAGAIERDKRLLYLTAIGLMGVALLLSGSRGGLVALLAEVFLLVLITTRRGGRGSLLLKSLLAGGLILVIVAGAYMIGGESSLTRLADSASTDNVSSDRFHIWSVTLDVIRENLPFGAGFGAFGIAYTPHDMLNGMERVEQAHNDYLEVLANAGVVGLLIGIGFLFLFFRTALRNINTLNLYRRGVAVGAFAGCFGILVHSLFDFVLHVTAVSLLFLTLLSLLVLSGRANPDDREIFVRRKKRRRKKATVTSIEERREPDA